MTGNMLKYTSSVAVPDDNTSNNTDTYERRGVGEIK